MADTLCSTPNCRLLAGPKWLRLQGRATCASRGERSVAGQSPQLPCNRPVQRTSAGMWCKPRTDAQLQRLLANGNWPMATALLGGSPA